MNNTLELGKQVFTLLKKFHLKSEFNDYPQMDTEVFILWISHNIGFRVCSDRFIQLKIDSYSIDNKKELYKFIKDLKTLDKIISILEKNNFKVGI